MTRRLLSLVLLLPVMLSAQEGQSPENFGDIFHSKKFLLGKNIFRGDVSYSLSKISYRDDTNRLQEFFRNAVKLNLHVNPWKDFFIRTTFFFDLTETEASPPWMSDFYYQIGYYNWRNGTFSFGYENYQPNRWATLGDKFIDYLKRGYVFVSFNWILSASEGKKTLRPFFWDDTSKLIFVPILKVHPEYQSEKNEFGGYFKPIAGLNFRYVIVKNIYLEAGLLYYPIKKTKLFWEPDFTYGFGIFDWRAFKINMSYGNWIANRFPWNPKELQPYGFLNGEFVLSVTYAW